MPRRHRSIFREGLRGRTSFRWRSAATRSISCPILKAVGAERPWAWCTSTRAPTQPRFEAASCRTMAEPFQQAVLAAGPFDPERSIQISIAAVPNTCRSFSFDQDDHVADEDIMAIGISASSPRRAKSSAAGRCVTFDVDGVDPGFAPGARHARGRRRRARCSASFVHYRLPDMVGAMSSKYVAGVRRHHRRRADRRARSLQDFLCLVATSLRGRPTSGNEDVLRRRFHFAEPAGLR